MNPPVRVLGVAAIAGGALRIADSFLTHVFSLATLAALYLETDMFLLLGMGGIYWSRRSRLGLIGTAGTVIFVIGILFVRLSAFDLFGAKGYQLGAAVALLGLALLSAETFQRRNGAYISASFWLVSLVFGVVGAMGVMPAAMMVLAGVAFGYGFVAAGAELLAV